MLNRLSMQFFYRKNRIQVVAENKTRVFTLFQTIFKNTTLRYCSIGFYQLILYRFFIGYWILKTGLNFYSDPFILPKIYSIYKKRSRHLAGPSSLLTHLKTFMKQPAFRLSFHGSFFQFQQTVPGYPA